MTSTAKIKSCLLETIHSLFKLSLPYPKKSGKSVHVSNRWNYCTPERSKYTVLLIAKK